MVITTKAQRRAIFRVFQRDFPNHNTPFRRNAGPLCPHCGKWAGINVKTPSTRYRSFRKLVQPGPGCIMLPWKGMWLGIEKDGYTHS